MNFFVPWINAIAIVIGGGLGSILGTGKFSLSRITYNGVLTQVCGAVIFGLGFIGAIQAFFVIEDGKLETQGTILMVLSLLIGWGLGEAFMTDRGLRKVGRWLQARFVSESTSSGSHSKKNVTIHENNSDEVQRFSEGFLIAITALCVSSMAVIGATEGNGNTLYIKSLIDLVLTVGLSMLYGVGVAFAAIPLLIIELGLMVLDGSSGGFMTAIMIDQIAFIGSCMVLLTGVNLAFGKKIKVGNLLPSLFVPIVYYWIIEVSTKTA